MKNLLLTLTAVIGLSAFSFSQTVNVRNVSGCTIEYKFYLCTTNNLTCANCTSLVSNNSLASCNTYVYNLSAYGEDYEFHYREAGSSGNWTIISSCNSGCNVGQGTMCTNSHSFDRVNTYWSVIYGNSTCSANDCY